MGDKLGLLERIARWLTPDGMFLGNLDLGDIRAVDGAPLAARVDRSLARAGFQYSRRTHVLSLRGRREATFDYHYRGAIDVAGANYTHQPSVRSVYAPGLARP